MNQPPTEWLRVMLEEIARKRQDAELAGVEAVTRSQEAPAVKPRRKRVERPSQPS